MEYQVREFSGRFKHLDERILVQMKFRLRSLLDSWGAVGGNLANEKALPLWIEVEFLDNVVRFEMECNPFLKVEIN